MKNAIGYLFANNINFRLIRKFSRKSLLIIYYHRVINYNELEFIRLNGMAVSINDFDRQMKFLKNHYVCISENDIIKSLENGIDLPDHSIWVTFDDGYKDNYNNAYPILKKYRIPATIFITTGFINREFIPWSDYISKAIRITNKDKIKFYNNFYILNTPKDKLYAIKSLWDIFDSNISKQQIYLEELINELEINISDIDNLFMTWDELIEVSRAGINVGNHTVTHRVLANLSYEEINQELSNSKNEIQMKLDKNTISFAYPRGKKQHYKLEKCISALQNNKFMLAVTTSGGFNSKIRPNRFNLKRFGLNFDDSCNFFKCKLIYGSFWQK